MCNFLSAIFRSDGTIIVDPEHSDSHTDLLEAHGIKDDKEAFLRHWVRVELTPPCDWKIIEDLSKWSFTLDEPGQAPGWWAEKEGQCRERMEKEVSAMFLRGARRILLGGTWILLSGAVVDKAASCRIVAMLWDSRIGRAQGSVSIGAMRGSAQIESMGDSAQIGSMRDSAQIKSMRDSAQIKSMRDSAQIGNMRDSAQIGSMGDSAQIKSMWGSAQIGSMWGNAQIKSMRDSAQIGSMGDSAQIESMGDSAQIGSMRDSAQIGSMWGSAQIKSMRDGAQAPRAPQTDNRVKPEVKA